MLYDRAAPAALLDRFNLRYGNPDTSDVHHFLQAYYELHQADYTYDGSAPCRQVLADNAHHYRQHDTLLNRGTALPLQPHRQQRRAQRATALGHLGPEPAF
ncbi:MAG: hypothetical protein WKG07_10020 [Hymenobacter sp.]